MNRTWAVCVSGSVAILDGLIFLLVLLSPQLPAHAALVPVLTQVADPPSVPFVSPEAALGPEWVSYQLDLQSTTAATFRVVTARIYGQFHQRWFDVDFDGISDPTPRGAAADGRGDSHLTPQANALFSENPQENNSGVGSPLADLPGSRDYGMGGGMSAVWGVSGPTEFTSTHVAYLVMPRDAVSALKFVLDGIDGTGKSLGRISSECPGYVCTAPNIDMVGNGYDIPDGDVVPSLFDGTDFGSVLPGSVQQRSFTIFNAGPGGAANSLNIRSPQVTGPFTVSGLTGVQSFVNRTFQVRLNTSVPGHYTGSISFQTDDPTAPVFNFNLAAHVIPEPATLLLVGLAAGGLAPLVRRRSC